MRKKLIALSIASLTSATAFAQSNVTIYGLVDFGYAYRFDGKNAGSSTPGVNTGTPNSSSQLNSGQSAGNRIGFKGTEDLGNGLKAVFLLEQGYLLDTGLAATSNSAFTRQAYMGLSGNFGTVIGGRLYTPHYNFVKSFDPFDAGTVGRYNNVYSNFPSLTNVGSLGDPTRVDNAVSYISPSFSGFSATALYSNNASQQEAAASNSANNTFYAVLGQYKSGPISAGINYHYIAAGTAVSSWDNVQNATIAGSYDFNVVKVAALYSWNELDYQASGTSNATINNYLLGVTAPFGKWAAKASYQYSDGNRAAGGDAQQFAIGLDYNLSKRTSFYSAYSFINNDDQRLQAVGDASNKGDYAAGNGYSLGGVFQQGIQLGLKHTF